MTTPLKVARRKRHSLRSAKGKKKLGSDLVTRRRFLVRNLHLLGKKPLKIVFFGSIFIRSEKMQKMFDEFLRKKGFQNNFILSNAPLNLSTGGGTTFARIKLLKSADIIVADSQLIESAKQHFPGVFESIKKKHMVKIDEFNPSKKEFQALLEKGLNKLLKRNRRE